MDDISAKHEELVKKYTRLVTAANNRGLQLSKLRTILSFRNIQKDVTETGVLKKCYLSKRVIFQFIFFVGVINSFSIYYYRFTLKEILEISSTKCLVDNNAFITELARPLTKCGICRNLDSVPIEHDINAVDFRRKYAYSSVPVLIKDATNEWSAMSVFSYQFFKDLYTGTEGALHYVEEECQFFPYNTDFKTLKDVFNMSGERAKFKDGETPWYIGCEQYIRHFSAVLHLNPIIIADLSLPEETRNTTDLLSICDSNNTACPVTRRMETDYKQMLIKQYSKLYKEAKGKGVPNGVIRNILTDSFKIETKCEQKNRDDENNRNRKYFYIESYQRKYMFGMIFVIGIVNAALFYYYMDSVTELVEIDSWRCIMDNNAFVSELTRPLAKCNFCNFLGSVPVEYLISADDFRLKFAYSSVPVLIKNATKKWSAMTNFSFQYFKTLYTETDGALASVDEECQFFRYNTDFDNLTEVFNMSYERANFTDGEKSWYIGWSNCHNVVKNELRKHYERPYFLPKDSESSSLDWIFMGGSGPGALIHLDYVQRPSWQAQISGTKTWTLIPPPECENECKTLNVTVHKGDIFVIDTNIWYHSTFIHPGDISITIGSEYD